MVEPREVFVKAVFGLVGIFFVWGFAASFGLLPMPSAYVWVGLSLLSLGAGYAVYRMGYHDRVLAPVWDEEFPSARMHVRPGGSFEWHPAGEIRAGVRHGIVHRWWDAQPGARFDARISFDIPDEVPPHLLAKATRRALSSATRALPSRGKVKARAAHRDDPGPRATVRVRLSVEASGAEPEWARIAAEALSRRLLAELGRRGHDVSRKRDAPRASGR